MAKAKVEKYFIAMGTFDKVEVEGIIKTFDECPNEQFGFRKISDRNWNVTHIRSGLEAVHGTSQQDCTKKLKQLFQKAGVVEHIHNCKDIDEVIKERKENMEKIALRNKKFHKLRDEFKQITGITCPIDPLIGGVDIVKLDEMLKTPDNVSMSDHLKEKYGDRANAIIDEMIS